MGGTGGGVEESPAPQAHLFGHPHRRKLHHISALNPAGSEITGTGRDMRENVLFCALNDYITYCNHINKE